MELSCFGFPSELLGQPADQSTPGRFGQSRTPFPRGVDSFVHSDLAQSFEAVELLSR